MISRLRVSGFRNLFDSELVDLREINVLYGENGAGKTSFLEAVHILSSSKSFRGGGLESFINHDSTGYSITGSVSASGLA